MRKPVILLSIMALGVSLLAGCGGVDVTTNTVIVEKDGKITEALVEAFDKEYYSEDELKAFVNEEIDAFEAEGGKDVKMSGLKVEEGTASMTMTFADADTYRDFNKVNFFVGTVVDAQTAGYDFEADFYAVKDGALDGGVVAGSNVVAEEGNVVIIQDCTDVQVPGTITYVSKGIAVNSDNSVSITKVNETDVAPVAYIIYK